MQNSTKFEKLDVWRMSMEFAEFVYLLTDKFPAEEKYGLVSQIRRAAVSIPSNTAEGWGRGPGPANLNFARIARGSCYELRTQLLLSGRLAMAPATELSQALCMLIGLQKALSAYIKGMEAKCVKEPLASYGDDEASYP